MKLKCQPDYPYEPLPDGFDDDSWEDVPVLIPLVE